jgi:hypothetical protein
MLAWLDGRNGSSFQGLSWSGGVLTFGIAVGAGANGLEAMVPTQGGGSALVALTRDGVTVPYTPRTTKGVSYAVFPAQPGTHQAVYGVPHTLTVTAPTHGTITGTGITCGTGGSDCTETYAYGTVVPLTATPDANYDFSGWTGACSGAGACSVTMTAARTVGATFTIQRHTLTVTAPTNGTITATGIACGTGGSDCTEAYDYGTVVPLTATPGTGYDLGGWTGACSGAGACSVTMTGARTVGATFTIQRYALTVTSPTHGTITATGIACGTGGTDCAETYDYGTVVPLTATPDTGYSLGGWTGACSGTGACAVTMTVARTAGATFAIQLYSLTVTTPTHGTVTATGIACGTGGTDCTQTYEYGTVVPLTTTPDTGYGFRAWTGVCSGSAPCSVTVDADKTVGGLFALTFQGTKGGPGAYAGPVVVTNESAVAPREVPPATDPVPPSEGAAPRPEPAPGSEPGLAPRSAPEPMPGLAPEGAASVSDAPRVFVSGEVRKPGAYAWFPGMTARHLISVAGGLTPEGSETIELDEPVKEGETFVVRRRPF